MLNVILFVNILFFLTNYCRNSGLTLIREKVLFDSWISPIQFYGNQLMIHNSIVKRLISLQINFDGIGKCVKSSKDKRNLSRNLIRCILDRHTSNCNIRYIYNPYFCIFCRLIYFLNHAMLIAIITVLN